MENSEEDILKRFLQDTFSDYEPVPDRQTWENIRKGIESQQPSVGTGLRQWIVPVVALLLLVGGIALNKNNLENETKLAINSSKVFLNIESQATDHQNNKINKLIKFGINNREEKSEKTLVNEATFKVKSKVLFEVEKPFKVPASSTIKAASMVKKNVQEYAVSTKEFVGIEDKPVVASAVVRVLDEHLSVTNRPFSLRQPRLNLDASDLWISGLSPHNKSKKSINPTNPNSDNILSMNDAVIEEVRYTKPLEILKNKKLVLVKNELVPPQIIKININGEAKPIRRPLYVSMNITPLQTYRILTINSQDIQNLQTNNTFDSERNGFAIDLGITKTIGNKWNLRGNISYLKMRQWAEYQVNTNNISVKNYSNYSNNVAFGGNDNEFIGQTRIEAKTLQMVGLKADVQRFFRISGRNRYFISSGSQLMYELTQKQSNVFINASAGFQHLVNKDCFLTIEPTASYLLNNINDSKSFIQTNAYNLGLKVGLSFRVK